MKPAAHIQDLKPTDPSPYPEPHPSEVKEPQRAGWSEVLEVARRHLKRFHGLEPKVLQGDDPDAIHDFRVASRRLQQVLDLLYAKPRPRKIGKLRGVVQRSRQILSTVRNCDVLLQRVNSLLARPRIAHPEAWAAFKEHLESQRSEAFQQAVRKLSRWNLSDFYVRLNAELHAAPPADSNPEGAVADGKQTGIESEAGLLDDRLMKELQSTWQAFEAQVARSQSERNPESLHAVRISAKRLRYLIEVIDELGLADARKILSGLRRLQQQLGDWHDLEVMEQMMADMISRPRFLRSHIDLAIKIERLMLRNQKSKATREKKCLDSAAMAGGCTELKEWVGKVTAGPADLESKN